MQRAAHEPDSRLKQKRRGTVMLNGSNSGMLPNLLYGSSSVVPIAEADMEVDAVSVEVDNFDKTSAASIHLDME